MTPLTAWACNSPFKDSLVGIEHALHDDEVFLEEREEET